MTNRHPGPHTNSALASALLLLPVVAQAQQAGAAGEQHGEAGGGEKSAKGDNVVDADFEEVKDEKK